uniref:Uncharacterized protein n=1 Tax=Zea mays TaxID=4577 RepID=A0A804ULL5_MAIZE
MFISCALLFFLPGARSLLSGLHAHRVQLPPPAVSAARPSLELRSASNSGARPSSLILLYNFDGGTICSVVILKEWLGIHRVAAAEISKGLPIFGIGVGHSTYDKASVITLMLAICLVGYSYSQNHKSAWFEAISTKPNK